MGYFLLRSSALKESYAMDGSLLLIAMLMLSPMSSKSHFVVLILPYMVVTGFLLKKDGFPRILAFILCLSFALNSLTSRSILRNPMAILMLNMGCVTIGTLLIFFMLFVILNRMNHEMDGNDDLPPASHLEDTRK